MENLYIFPIGPHQQTQADQTTVAHQYVYTQVSPPPPENKTGGLTFRGGLIFGSLHFAATLPFPTQKMSEPMLLDNLQLGENDTIDEVESSDDSDLEVVEAPMYDEEPRPKRVGALHVPWGSYFWDCWSWVTGGFLLLGGVLLLGWGLAFGEGGVSTNSGQLQSNSRRVMTCV